MQFMITLYGDDDRSGSTPILPLRVLQMPES
jgi:hypothetical protein